MTALLIGATELVASPESVVLDVRWNLTGPDGRAEFLQGHIPGARFVDLSTELAGPSGADGRHPLPSYEVFAAAMRRVGVRPDTQVVVTDGGSTLPAARLWWMLTDAGHQHVRVLDGGVAAWTAAGLPVEVGADRPVPAGDFVGAPGHRAVVSAADVADHQSLVDVRAHERFTGATEPIDPVGGHIPGAVNAPSTENFDQGRFRPAAELRQRFDQLGVGADSVVYCGSGITACQTLLAMELAGIDGGALFPGSWSAWVADPSRPVATGDQPIS